MSWSPMRLRAIYEVSWYRPSTGEAGSGLYRGLESAVARATDLPFEDEREIRNPFGRPLTVAENLRIVELCAELL